MNHRQTIYYCLASNLANHGSACVVYLVYDCWLGLELGNLFLKDINSVDCDKQDSYDE